MLNIKTTNCTNCHKISELIDSIDCQLNKMAKNYYQNISLMLNKPVEGSKMSTLIHYKRILLYMSENVDWSCYSLNDIASRISYLTAGCQCCDESRFPNRDSFVTTSTTTSTTSTTTTTVGPVLLTFYTFMINKNPLVSPNLDKATTGMPYSFSWNGSNTVEEIPYDPAYTLNLTGFQTLETDVTDFLSSKDKVVSVTPYYPPTFVYSNINNDSNSDILYKWQISLLPGESLFFYFKNNGHGANVAYRYTFSLSSDGLLFNLNWSFNTPNLPDNPEVFQTLSATPVFYDKDRNNLMTNDVVDADVNLFIE